MARTVEAAVSLNASQWNMGGVMGDCFMVEKYCHWHNNVEWLYFWDGGLLDGESAGSYG